MFKQAITNRDLLQEKLHTIPIVLLLIICLPPLGVAYAYLILGHAHFTMTLIYQIKRGALNFKSVLFYLGCLVSLFVIAFEYPKAFTLFVAIALLFHVYFGEVRHIKKTFGVAYLLVTIGLSSIIGSWLAVQLWGVPINQYFLNIGVLLILCIGIFAWYLKYKLEVELFFVSLILLTLFFIFLDFCGLRPSSFESFGFIVIAHYLTTYFNVFKSFKKRDNGTHGRFVIESLVVNLIFLIGFIIVFKYLGKDNFLYQFAYSPIAFYVWTLMHFITTMNFVQIRSFFMKLV